VSAQAISYDDSKASGATPDVRQGKELELVALEIEQ
jgi:hypothetical protein